MPLQAVSAVIVEGHKVASGQAEDPRFPIGTLRLQIPVFARLGIDLAAYYPGTINLSIAPCEYTVVQPQRTFRNVRWAPDRPAEDFSFFDCEIVLGKEKKTVKGLVYYPHPETKPEHFQDAQTLEVLAPYVETLTYGKRVELRLDSDHILIQTP
ncbi:MAG: hypothetical protein AAFY78_06785 [Cyanobacteria bacterium J06648_16]